MFFSCVLHCNFLFVSRTITCTFSFTGRPEFVTDLKLAGFTTVSAMLTFAAPAHSPCIANYIITTNASAPSSTTDTNVTITRPTNDQDGVTYSVSVVAVDFANRIGEGRSLGCFMFSGKGKLPLFPFMKSII